MRKALLSLFALALLVALAAPAQAVDGCCQLVGSCKQAPDLPIHQNKCAFHGGVWNAPGICQANGECLWASGFEAADSDLVFNEEAPVVEEEEQVVSEESTAAPESESAS